METFKVRMKTVSPVHVGTGEVYEPTEFFVAKNTLWEIDFEKFVKLLPPKRLLEFKKLCFDGRLEALVGLYDFVNREALKLIKSKKFGFVKREVRVSPGFVGHYKKVRRLRGSELRREFNRFVIEKSAYSPNKKCPILPGSSVKGALRTAILNFRRSRVVGNSWSDYCRGNRCDSRRLESEILEFDRKRINQDPLRLLKVSDFRPAGKVKTRIVYAVNVRKDGEGGRGPYQILEVIEPGAVFEGEVSFLGVERGAGAGIRNPVTYEELKQALKAFYGKELSQEAVLLEHIGTDVPVCPEEGLPLRVGRHSGAECVTIEGFRRILIKGRGGRTEFRDHATTIWLASEDSNPSNTASLKPFGWVSVTVN